MGGLARSLAKPFQWFEQHALGTRGDNPDQPGVARVMPQMDDEAVQAARKKALLTQFARGGRDSTFLSDTDNSKQALGGG